MDPGQSESLGVSQNGQRSWTTACPAFLVTWMKIINLETDPLRICWDKPRKEEDTREAKKEVWEEKTIEILPAGRGRTERGPTFLVNKIDQGQ
ncbi:hypothetical protein AVEN_167912-1 [Araneus ventricosus]|uniref:Uncharacterized protein n=1 Tax=Araneus ventricosus TaxID=182803 RepID=A0A4Y2FY68_ARAVE|nr:hypothetical protein AVEN_167912-1 [Araneus ventricosus]